MSKYQFGSIVDRDFRNTLQRLADDATAQGKAIQDLVAEGQLTEEQYAQLISTINGLVKSGDIDKYDFNTSLRKEFNEKAKKGEITADDFNKNGKLLDSTFFTSEFIQSLSNAELDVTNVLDGSLTNAKYARKSISADKTDFVEESSNILNWDSLMDNKAVNSQGEIIDNNDYYLTEMINVSPGDTLYSVGPILIAQYDKNGVFIRRDNVPETEVGGSFTVGNTTYSVRYNLRKFPSIVDKNISQINRGSEKQPFEPYYLKFVGALESNRLISHTVKVPLEVAGINKSTGIISSALESGYENRRRTGNFLEVQPDTPIKCEYDLGQAYILEYAKDFGFIRSRSITSDDEITLSKNTARIKIVVENVGENDFVNCTVNFKSTSSHPKWVKNSNDTNVQNDNINFVYEVDVNQGRDIYAVDSTDAQYDSNKYYNSGLLKLPPNYDPFGDPVKLIIFCHGSADYLSFTANSFGRSYESYFDYIKDEGYAILDVYDWTTKYMVTNSTNFGSPTTMAAIVQGYKWVAQNYNISTEGVFVSGKSAGGHRGLNLPGKGVPITAIGMLAPAISPLVAPYAFNYEGRQATADDFGFEGDVSVLDQNDTDYLSKTTEVQDYIKSNADRMIGYNPYWNGLIGESLETLSEFAATGEEELLSNYSSMSRVTNTPIKIWVAADDDGATGIYKQSEIYIKTVKNAQGLGELRTMPEGTGKHHAVDYHADALKVESIQTKLGHIHNDVPLAFVELIQFFRRFEN